MMASDGDRERAIRLLLEEPAPPVYDGLADSAHQRCWRDMLGIFRQDSRVVGLSSEEVRCIRLLAYYHCGARHIEAAESGHPGFLQAFPGKYDSDKFEFATMDRAARKLCGGRDRKYMTDRALAVSSAATRVGDDVLGWRRPSAPN